MSEQLDAKLQEVWPDLRVRSRARGDDRSDDELWKLFVEAYADQMSRQMGFRVSGGFG
jgi:hypothetical protein